MDIDNKNLVEEAVREFHKNPFTQEFRDSLAVSSRYGALNEWLSDIGSAKEEVETVLEERNRIKAEMAILAENYSQSLLADSNSNSIIKANKPKPKPRLHSGEKYGSGCREMDLFWWTKVGTLLGGLILMPIIVILLFATLTSFLSTLFYIISVTVYALGVIGFSAHGLGNHNFHLASRCTNPGKDTSLFSVSNEAIGLGLGILTKKGISSIAADIEVCSRCEGEGNTPSASIYIKNDTDCYRCSGHGVEIKTSLVGAPE